MSRPIRAVMRRVALAWALAAGTAAGQGTGIEEVIVTATKMGETPLQSTPIAISAFTADELEARGVGDVGALVDYVPGLQISDVNGYAQLYLRGVGSNNVFIGSDPSTTVHVDGVYIARPVAYFVDFLDVERVEVLRGPQGTRYGRNSVGGTVNVISRRPTRTPTGQIQLTGGTYDEMGFKGYVSGPIAGSGLLGSLSVARSRRHGYFDNVSGGDDLVYQDSFGVRGQLYAPLGERADITLRADFHHSDEAMGGSSKLLEPIGVPLDDSILGDYRKVSVNAPNDLEIRTYGVSADFSYDVSDRATIRSLTAYRSLKSENVTDADASSLDVTRALFDLRQDQFSQELTLNARFDRLSLVAGLYYFRETDREPASVILPLFGLTHFQRPHLTAESHAVFAQAEYRFNERLHAERGDRGGQGTGGRDHRRSLRGHPAVRQRGVSRCPIYELPRSSGQGFRAVRRLRQAPERCATLDVRGRRRLDARAE